MRCITVDDDKISRELIHDYIVDTPELELLGEFPSAIEANNFLSKTHVDLIFLDVEMPKMNGLEVCTQLKRKDSGINICFLTASSEPYREELLKEKYNQLS